MSSKHIGVQSLTIKTCMLNTTLDYCIHLGSWQQGSLDNVWALKKCHGRSEGHVQSRCLLTLGWCFTSLHIFSVRSENLNGEHGHSSQVSENLPLHLYLVSFYFSKLTVALHFLQLQYLGIPSSITRSTSALSIGMWSEQPHKFHIKVRNIGSITFAVGGKSLPFILEKWLAKALSVNKRVSSSFFYMKPNNWRLGTETIRKLWCLQSGTHFFSLLGQDKLMEVGEIELGSLDLVPCSDSYYSTVSISATQLNLNQALRVEPAIVEKQLKFETMHVPASIAQCRIQASG